MFKQLMGATVVLFIGVGSLSAQHGGGGGGHGGGGFGGGGGRGGFGGGYGGYGGYGRGYGGFYGGYGWGLGGLGFGYPYYGGYYDLGGLGYSSFGGYGSGGGGIYPGTPIIPYSSNYTPSPSTNIDPTILPSLPIPFTPPSAPASASVAATASLTVIVPEGGQVWFDNTLTPQTGAKWVYTSPKLDAGKTYTLNIKARWAEGGQDKAYDIPLRIVAGDKMTMDLTKIR